MRRVDRSSARDARFVLEELIPDVAARGRWRDLLSDAMTEAHQVHRGSWAVTLFDDGLRLNVGTIETIVLRPGGAVLVLDSSQFTDEEIRGIQLSSSSRVMDLYVSVPGTVNLDVPYDVEERRLSALRQALLPLIRRAASGVRTRTGYAKSHSPGVVDHLRQITGRPLRPPGHS